MTPTTQPVELSKEAMALAETLWKAGFRNSHFTENNIRLLARIIDSSFAELRRERDAMRNATRELTDLFDGLPLELKLSIVNPDNSYVIDNAHKLLATTPDAGRGK